MTSERPAGVPEASGLRIAYLLPQFPVPTQTFAVSDIAALQVEGHSVQVHTIKASGRSAGDAGSAASLPVSRPTLRGALRWPGLLWRMRAPVLSLAWSIIRQAGKAPGAALSALLCLPRAAEIAADIERERPDVVHLFWARHAGLVLALLKARGFAGVRSAFVGAYDLVADDFLVDLSLRSADIVFSHSEANREYVETRAPPGTRVEIIYRGIPLPDLRGEVERDPDLWITASALVQEKNAEGVLLAFAQARVERPQLRLAVFGDGPDRTRLERCCQSQGNAAAVDFRGHVERDELLVHMAQADVFLLLSKKPSERLPNVVKEALWAGCEVISSNSVGIREVLPDETYGHVVDPDDESAVMAAARAVLRRDRTADQARQAKARQLISDRFCAATNMRRYAQAWTDHAAAPAEPSGTPVGNRAGQAAQARPVMAGPSGR